jgi:hypothetical protein
VKILANLLLEFAEEILMMLEAIFSLIKWQLTFLCVWFSHEKQGLKKDKTK